MVVAWNICDFFFLRKKSSCYVDVSKVYSGFEMKKEYEKIIKNQEVSNRNTVDSLELDLRQISMRIEKMDSVHQKNQYRDEIGNFLQKREKYMQIKNSLEYNYKNNVQTYDEKIWKQINMAVTDFGKDRGYDYIFGAIGNGSMMYASEGDNVTDEFLKYLNKKYQDG